MAKYIFTHSCGHGASVEVRSADAVAIERSHIQGTLCKDCFFSREQSLADTTECAYSMPELIGSPAQVKWARSIRAQAYLLVNDALDVLGDGECKAEFLGWHPVGIILETTSILHWLFESRVDAKFWIDHRYYDGFALINLALFHCIVPCVILDDGECVSCGTGELSGYKPDSSS